ncbi:hypothetical protein HN954_02280 [bacterium]|jgi:hypothetical protein|nr:hypothetical protein [bacterium]MBT6831552.1 hypothetical protein [bacterium]MBT6996233.1 hypothetical protein [bacterium]MBT7772274.1 hypothetical protein [bacterium]
MKKKEKKEIDKNATRLSVFFIVLLLIAIIVAVWGTIEGSVFMTDLSEELEFVEVLVVEKTTENEFKFQTETADWEIYFNFSGDSIVGEKYSKRGFLVRFFPVGILEEEAELLLNKLNLPKRQKN